MAQQLTGDAPPANVRTRGDFVALIGATYGKTVEGFVEIGRLLNQAKAELAHGEFLDMVERDLPFGPRTANKLMAIGTHATVSNKTHESHLPAAWSTLYEISRLPPE